jgi:hypothetical protein
VRVGHQIYGVLTLRAEEQRALILPDDKLPPDGNRYSPAYRRSTSGAAEVTAGGGVYSSPVVARSMLAQPTVAQNGEPSDYVIVEGIDQDGVLVHIAGERRLEAAA